jgi:hypothetical protein
VWLFLISDDSPLKKVFETILQKKRRMTTEEYSLRERQHIKQEEAEDIPRQ